MRRVFIAFVWVYLLLVPAVFGLQVQQTVDVVSGRCTRTWNATSIPLPVGTAIPLPPGDYNVTNITVFPNVSYEIKVFDISNGSVQNYLFLAPVDLNTDETYTYGYSLEWPCLRHGYGFNAPIIPTNFFSSWAPDHDINVTIKLSPDLGPTPNGYFFAIGIPLDEQFTEQLITNVSPLILSAHDSRALRSYVRVVYYANQNTTLFRDDTFIFEKQSLETNMHLRNGLNSSVSYGAALNVTRAGILPAISARDNLKLASPHSTSQDETLPVESNVTVRACHWIDNRSWLFPFDCYRVSIDYFAANFVLSENDSISTYYNYSFTYNLPRGYGLDKSSTRVCSQTVSLSPKSFGADNYHTQQQIVNPPSCESASNGAAYLLYYPPEAFLIVDLKNALSAENRDNRFAFSDEKFLVPGRVDEITALTTIRGSAVAKVGFFLLMVASFALNFISLRRKLHGDRAKFRLLQDAILGTVLTLASSIGLFIVQGGFSLMLFAPVLGEIGALLYFRRLVRRA